ncbi:MAG: lipopolysaccharide assembly LapA domain-containing protein [Paenisporosarcina sp.]
MKFQWSLLIGLIFAVIVAIFAVVNVDSVPVNYVFGSAEWPLILVILGSALLGALISGSVAIFRSFVLQRRVNHLEKEVMLKESLIATQQNEITAIQKNEPVRYQDADPVGDQNTTI